MSVLDTYVWADLSYKLLENGNSDAAYPTLLTSMFSAQELLDALNRVQQDFLLQTGMIVTLTTITGVINVSTYPLPTDSIRPRRLTWTDSTATGQPMHILTQVDTWELDNGNADWQQQTALPIAWYENNLQQQTIGVATAPSNLGTIGLLYIQLAAALTGLGVAFSVPDDWTPYIMYGALADLLGSDGPAYDPARMEYCQNRYSEGIELANLILGGY